jgi:hypothetical protein
MSATDKPDRCTIVDRRKENSRDARPTTDLLFLLTFR